MKISHSSWAELLWWGVLGYFSLLRLESFLELAGHIQNKALMFIKFRLRLPYWSRRGEVRASKLPVIKE